MNISLEDRLLILCARSHFDEQEYASIFHLLRQNLDWNYLISASIQHGTALLLYNGLRIATDNFNEKNQTSACVPNTVKAELEALYLRNHHRTERLHRVMAEIFAAFDQQSIEFIALKEIGLMQFAYPDASLRPIGDLDLLIHKHAFGKVEKCLDDLGFRPLPAANCHYRLAYLSDYTFQRAADNVWLDIQWAVEDKGLDITGEAPLDFEISRIWQNARPIEIAGHQVLIPSPVDMLFHLCIHLEGHGYTELILLADIAAAIRAYQDDLDWNNLIGLTQKYGMQATVYYVLLWVKTLFNVAIPPCVFEELTPSYFKAYLFEAIFGNLASLHGYSDEISLVAAPPNAVMKEFELIARRNAAGARHLYQVIDAAMLAFKAAGGQLIIFNGEPSSVIFPSSALPAFNPLQLFICADDLALLATALQDSGFKDYEAYSKGPFTGWSGNFTVRSKEPVLADHPFNLAVKWQIQVDNRELFNSKTQANTISETKKAIAKQIIKAALRGKANSSMDIETTIYIYPLRPEEILAFLCAKAGQAENRKLLAACNILEFFRIAAAPGTFDWKIFLELINSPPLQIIESIYGSLLMAYQAVDPRGQATIAHGLKSLRANFPEASLASIQPRILTWARYGPASLTMYETSLKNIFFVLLTFLSIKRMSAKLAYIRRLIFSSINEKKSLFRLGWLMMDLILLPLRALGVSGKKHYAPKDFIYWLE